MFNMHATCKCGGVTISGATNVKFTNIVCWRCPKEKT